MPLVCFGGSPAWGLPRSEGDDYKRRGNCGDERDGQSVDSDGLDGGLGDDHRGQDSAIKVVIAAFATRT